jgi:hypothetical protein
MNFKKLWDDYGIGTIVVLLLVAYGVHLLANYLTRKSSFEGFNNNNNPPRGAGPAEPNDSLNQDFARVNYRNNNKNIQNPNDLLPRNGNNNWLSPNGKGELSNVSLLKAGYHLGIDTVSSSLRNANLQLRSEPPNPQNQVGPWNQTTITPEVGRPSLEIGQGPD